MDRRFQSQELQDLVHGKWGASSISVHNRISDVRALLALLGEDYLQLDPIAVEIETIAGIALGMGDEQLTKDDLTLLSVQVENLKRQLSSIRESRS
ncbi:hypothetical protein [Roseinatronobacter alkalisoli]|uniref:Uncharacterized protein n=1 Tax=Roseinatronobacter alkalisoli TaxID=3028235 RepID=A0ABT5TEU5_9RHOB|nr:hypothetical protein [Roseinatronobacter sp. HJB301]MDD7973648.1 hypothetical protein [Roseinatronobacter sp. HJB301]